MKTLNTLIEQHGYIREEQIDKVAELFGENFEIVLKDYNGERYKIRIGTIDEVVAKTGMSIREVFMYSQDYRILEEAMKEFEELNNAKAIANLVASKQSII